MTRLAFLFDAASCSGCKCCQVACKDAHGQEVGSLWRRVYEIQAGKWRRDGLAWRAEVAAYFMSISCNHCERPPCVNACPVGAIGQRDDGIVLIDDQRCMGCGYCGWSCPFDAPQFDEAAGVMRKCSFCVERIDSGEIPLCVAACPMRALDFGDLEELRRRHAGCWPSSLPSMDIGPALIVLPHRQTAMADGLAVKLANIEEV